MINKEIADIFQEISSFLKMEGVQFKPSAYRKAALTLENLEKDITEIYRGGGKKALEKIPGVGKSMAEKIEEYLKTGKIKYYQSLKKKTPVQMRELIRIEGLGPKTVKVLYQKLGIRNIKDLEEAANAHRIAPLFGFGETTEKNILEGIEFLKKSKGRFLLGEILPEAKQIEKRLRDLKEIEQVSVAGSVRRKKETIGDIDFLVATKKADLVMDFFVSRPEVVKVWGKGSAKSSVRLKQGLDVDLRIVPQKSYGSALQYFTGSKDHNIKIRKIAIDKGLKLNEYGVFRGKKQIAGKTEEGVYKTLGMQCPLPEMRENRGEVELSLEGKLPCLVELKDIKGDLHSHSKWDGGKNSILEMARAAMARGYQYLGITDHTKFLKIEHGLNEKQLSQQRREIDRLNERFKIQGLRFKILQGAETNILNDGSLDIQDWALEKLDYVNAGVHSNFKMSRTQMTDRIIKALKNPYLKILVHPTGRILKQRDEFQADWDKIFRAAKECGIVLEINSHPKRLDLNDKNVKIAKEMGIKMVINADAHHIDHLRYMEYGLYQARRGWAEKEDIINSYSLEKLLKFFKR